MPKKRSGVSRGITLQQVQEQAFRSLTLVAVQLSKIQTSRNAPNLSKENLFNEWFKFENKVKFGEFIASVSEWRCKYHFKSSVKARWMQIRERKFCTTHHVESHRREEDVDGC